MLFETQPVIHVVGARPNFMKLSPVHLAFSGRICQRILHTGQHYDRRMSDEFFDLLGLPEPDYSLGIGSDSHARQTARIMIGLGDIFSQERPAAVVVYGDVNSTLAATLVAAKMHIPVVHVEAGLRSGDRLMPEEQNRLVTDQLSQILLTHSREANQNLLREGIGKDRIFFVGNVMIDSLLRMLPIAEDRFDPEGLGNPSNFALVTLHRPSNVDDNAKLKTLVGHLLEISEQIPIVFPVHPRTRKKLEELGLSTSTERLMLMEPMDYLTFIMMQKTARFVITDSGGIQEETTLLMTPCLTLRTTTERPVTIEVGTNTLVGDNPENLGPYIETILDNRYKIGKIPELWDGQAATRICNVLEKVLQ